MEAPSIRDLLEHTSFVRRLAHGLAGDAQAAEDLVQETWLAGLENPPQDARNLRGWLRTVARRLSRQRRERAGRERELARELTRERPRAGHDEQRLALASAVSRAVLELREPYRGVVLLRFYEGLPPREIARRTGRPRNTVQSQLRRALEELRVRLERELEGGRAALLPLAGSLLRARETPAHVAPSAAAASGTSSGTLGASWLASAAPAALLGLALLGGAAWWLTREDAALAPLVAADAAVTLDEARPASAAPGAARVAVDARGGAPVEARGERAAEQRASAPGPAPLGAATTLELVVRDPEGRPLQGARIVVGALGDAPTSFGSQGARYAASTDSQGRAQVELAAHELGRFETLEGCAFVSAEALGRVPAPGTWVVPPPAGTPVELVVGPLGRRVVGRVLDASGLGVAGAELRLGTTGPLRRGEGRIEQALPLAARSGAGGAFALEGVPAGKLTCFVAAPGYATALAWLEAEHPLDEELVLRLVREARLEGVARDESGAPLAGVRVALEPERALGPAAAPSATSASDGAFALGGLGAGRRFACALDASGTRAAREFVALEPGASARWEPLLRALAPLALRCVDEDGVPRAGLGVQLELERDPAQWSRLASLDAQGELALLDVPDEPVRAALFATREELLGGAAPLLVAQGLVPRAEAHALVVPAQAAAPARVRARLLDEEGATFAGAAAFLLERASGRVRAAVADLESGAVELAEVPAGVHVLVVLAGSRGACSFGELALEAGETRELGALHLPAAGRLELHWEWSGAESLQLVQILEGKHWTIAAEAAPRSGERALLPGRYRVQCLREGRVRERRHVELVGGATTLLASGPAPLVEAQVELRAAEAAELGATAHLVALSAQADAPPLEHELVRDAEGRLRAVIALPQGTWRLRAESASGLSGEAPAEIALGPQPPTVIVELR